MYYFFAENYMWSQAVLRALSRGRTRARSCRW